MENLMTTQELLINFEKEIAQLYEQKLIRGPVHLRNGNEQILINIFTNYKIGPNDYVFSTWASHLHALLKKIPSELIKAKILAGHSINLMFPEHRFYTSAIVGGICPIAVGIAWAIKQRRGTERVFCFIGDMASLTGIATESIRYATNFDLPILFIIEDNFKSVATPTKITWGWNENTYINWEKLFHNSPKVISYRYNLTYPHASTGKFIHF
jgi:acetoin:2,6-dichlorophenolindophenol oxidoreductase subunit alpha